MKSINYIITDILFVQTSAMEPNYLQYYRAQSGRGLQYNEDFGGLIRSPKLLQRGRGLGGVFANLFRYIKPLLYSGLNYFKDEALDAGSQFLQGKNPRDILREKGIAAVDKLREKAAEKINKMSGSGRKRKRSGKTSKCKKQKTNNIKPPKRQRISIKRRSPSKKHHSSSALKAFKLQKQKLNDIFK